MKPEALKWPYDAKDRKVLLEEKVLFVPFLEDGTEETFVFPGWNNALLFSNDHPIKLEYCSGNGSWIAEKAKLTPQVNWVALEMKFSRIRKIWSKIQNHRISNLLAVCGEALDVTSRFIPSESISELFINFPDPWPKRRHAKYRLIQNDFLNEMARILKTGYDFQFVTDSKEYSEWTLNLVSKNSHFESCYPFPYYKTEIEDYGTSYFDTLWRDKGRIIYYHKFKKCK